MKKILLLFLICTVLLSMSACGKDAEETSDQAYPASTEASSDKNDTTALDTGSSGSIDLSTARSSEQGIENTAKRLINALDGVQIDTLTVMGAANASEPGQYKIYAIITWDRKHNPADSQKILQDYSDSIANSADVELGNIQDLSLVWLVPSLQGRASITYEKTEGMLALKEEAYDKGFGNLSGETSGSALQANSGTAASNAATGSAVTN